MQPWWRRDPDRLKTEMVALEQAQFKPVVHRQDEKTGILELHLQYPHEDGVTQLQALFPVEYPHFPPQVFGPELRLQRHQHPVSHNLCLLGNPTADWSVHDTLADLLKVQLPQVLKNAAEPESESAAQTETPQGEPWSEYPEYPDGAQLVVSSFDVPLGVTSGRLLWAVERANPLRGALIEVRDDKGRVIAQAVDWVQARYRDRPPYHGEWRRLDHHPRIDSPRSHFDSVISPRKIGARSTQQLLQPRLAATLFPEEVRWRQRRDGWVFSAFFPPGKNALSGYYFLRPAQAAEAELFARTPELKALRDKHVVIVGLGMLGSPAVLQFARAGIRKLTICDGDYVELGTIPRWSMGWDASGWSKVRYLERLVREQYPYVHVESIHYRIGDPTDRSTCYARLEAALADADLIFDASADRCVSNFVRNWGLLLGTPHVWIETTPGCWGGLIGRYVPGRSGCWACMKLQQADGGIPIPPGMEGGEVQPAGCRTPTSTGAGFDSDVVVMEGMRMAIGLLSEDTDYMYPSVGWDVGVLKLRTDEGKLVPPAWECFRLAPHPQCNHD